MTLVRPTDTPLRKAASWLLPMAYRTRPAVERRSGIQITPTMTRRTTSARGMKSSPREPFTIPVSQSADPPPGEGSTTSAAPAHTNDMASVTTMSGTRVITTRAPLMPPRMSPRTRTPRTTGMAKASDWSFMRSAAVTLVRAIIEPIERSMPPEMTTMAWATAAMASGMAPTARPWSCLAP